MYRLKSIDKDSLLGSGRVTRASTPIAAFLSTTNLRFAQPIIRFPYNQPMESDQLILQGHATDRVWAMRSPNGTIGLCLDSGEAGTVFLSPEQARAVIETLEKMLR
jgi:hypothetical protein